MNRTLFTSDIHSLSAFRSNASGFIDQIHNTKRPLVITQNGKSAAVLLDVHEYEKLMDKIELFQDIETGFDQINSNKGIGHTEAHQLLKSRYSKSGKAGM